MSSDDVITIGFIALAVLCLIIALALSATLTALRHAQRQAFVAEMRAQHLQRDLRAEQLRHEPRITPPMPWGSGTRETAVIPTVDRRNAT